jgi:hypothetical protein
MPLVPYFAYGTTQNGFAHHRRFADLLGEPVGRARTVSAHAVVVPRRAACSNPGCQYVHRMAALMPGFEPLRVEGDLFLIGRAPTGSQARTVVNASRSSRWTALRCASRLPASFARRRAGRRSSSSAEPDALTTYPRERAAAALPKACCVRTPGHPPPHDVVDPLDSVDALSASRVIRGQRTGLSAVIRGPRPLAGFSVGS